MVAAVEVVLFLNLGLSIWCQKFYVHVTTGERENGLNAGDKAEHCLELGAIAADVLGFIKKQMNNRRQLFQLSHQQKTF